METYIASLNEKQFCEITLHGESVKVHRARFGLHIQLSDISVLFDESVQSQDYEKMDMYIHQYFDILEVDIDGAKPSEILQAFVSLRLDNTLKFKAPFLTQSDEGNSKVPPYDYPGRTWALWVHMIASRYGWSKSQIFDLWPEEAACYMQEIALSTFEEMENQRALSEVSYQYDKNTKKSKFIPMTKPGWMVKSEQQRQSDRELFADGTMKKSWDYVPPEWMPPGAIDLSEVT